MKKQDYDYEKPDKPILVKFPRKAPSKNNQEGGDTRWYT